MSVNLYHLRESMHDADRGGDVMHAFGLSMDAARLMLESRTVWWCGVVGAPWDACGHPADAGCGLRALVPVEDTR